MQTEPSGVLIVNKHGGVTSHDIVFKIRKLFGTKKVGHTGTLDPMATGVLVVLLIVFMVYSKRQQNKRQEEQMAKAAGIRGEVTEIGWGNQIRSYVMQPYTLVKDHRTNVESGNVASVLDGNIDLFMNAYLKGQNKEET